MVGLKASSEVWADFMLPKSKRSIVHHARLSALFKRLAADRSRTRPVVKGPAAKAKDEDDPMGHLLGVAVNDTGYERPRMGRSWEAPSGNVRAPNKEA